MGDEEEQDDSWIAEMYAQSGADVEYEDEGECRVLYRPVGRKELELIADSGFSRFPPRLYFQPIFYPVLNEEYARQIARDWNTKDEASGFAGYVTRFKVRLDYLAGFEVQHVGGNIHHEYWIPADQMDAFNAAIVGPIEVIAEYLPTR